MDSKIQQFFPHVLNAIINSPNQENSLENIIEFIQGTSQLKNLQIDVEGVQEALRKGIDFGLITNKNNVFGITFNPFLSGERNRRALESVSSEANYRAETWNWENEKPDFIDLQDESESENDFVAPSNKIHKRILNARSAKYPTNRRRSRVQGRKRKANKRNSKSNRYKKH